MMKSFQLYHLQLLYLLIAALLECEVATLRRCKQVHQLNINCVQGDSMSISCLTTTHPLQSLTVKLHRTNQDKNILMYPDISPEPEHQRWSVRKDAGNVTLDLKNIRLSDSGLYDCQVYKDQDCLHATRFNLTIIKCKTLDSVHPTPGSSVLLPCSEHPLQHRTEQVTWKVVNGHQSTDITQYRPPHKPSSRTGKLLKPLYERVRQLKNGSLLIRDVANIDALWYQCRVNEKTCYEVKLMLLKVITDAPTPADCTVSQTEDYNTDKSETVTTETVTTNVTIVVMTTIVSLCVLISLTVCVILYLKKPRPRIDNQIESNYQSPVYYSEVSGGLDVPLYSLVQPGVKKLKLLHSSAVLHLASVYDEVFSVCTFSALLSSNSSFNRMRSGDTETLQTGSSVEHKLHSG
ncbi:V-set and immunoglobulin domain-containing protein 8 [Labeo rohita]|nr:V-set and immunoglobulin domain-containing protein 8 [Labeo rohita]